jgi:hypothetical protein
MAKIDIDFYRQVTMSAGSGRLDGGLKPGMNIITAGGFTGVLRKTSIGIVSVLACTVNTPSGPQEILLSHNGTALPELNEDIDPALLPAFNVESISHRPVTSL